MRPHSILAAAASLAATVASQSGPFSMTPATQVSPSGAAVAYGLSAPSGTVYSILANLTGGPTDFLGERFYLDVSPTLVTLDAGVMPTLGRVNHLLNIPPFAGALGLVIYGQGATIDSTAPNGLFRVTNAESSVLYTTPTALVESFDNPLGSGFTGSFSQSIRGHISGGAITQRTHEVLPNAAFFPHPLQNPLNPLGCREQMVFRASDIGATGEREVVTAIRWYSLTPVSTDSFGQITLLAGHTPVVPDYSLDPWTALPVAPGSGLDPVFTQNYVPNEPPQIVFSGRYDLSPSSRRFDGYVPLPVLPAFEYDGSSSLLLEFQTDPDANATGLNGFYGHLMVQSSPNPAARNTKGGTPTGPVIPSQATTGDGDNWLAQMQFEFARVTTEAVSPFQDSQHLNPDYDTPRLATSLPSGTSVAVEYRGSANSSGTNPTAWSASPDIADGLRYLQYRITFRADLATGEVPVIDTLVVPIR
ncbi:MAG: hypothetical protein NXI31_05865 [bacterium]|nr:hypothetical protein [bacterium]